MKKALISGISGQDGSYLAELLLSKGYEVHGIIRRASNINTQRIDHIIDDVKLHYGDLTDSSSLNRLLAKIEPNEIYNLGAQSHVAVSFSVPEYTLDTNGLGTLRLLDAIKEIGLNVKFYQASSSELFGKNSRGLQSETTPFYPRSPYGIAKLCAYWLTVNYREAYNLFACNGILFNHESPRRGINFVTKKIATAIAAIVCGKQQTLSVGNLYAKRDWGYAPEYVDAMWRILQQEKPDDYVIATGETHSVKDFINAGFTYVNKSIEWLGTGVDEHAIDMLTGTVVVKIDPRYYRPTEVDFLLGDASKAREILNWTPKVRFQELVGIMVDHELQLQW